MKKIEAIIKPFKLEDVKDALLRSRRARHDRHRSKGIRTPERSHRNLSRQRIHRRLPPKSEARRSSSKTATPNAWSTPFRRRPTPAKSVTARSSSRRSRALFASGPEKRVRTPSSLPRSEAFHPFPGLRGGSPTLPRRAPGESVLPISSLKLDTGTTQPGTFINGADQRHCLARLGAIH